MPGLPDALAPRLLPRGAAVRLLLLAVLAAALGYLVWFWQPDLQIFAPSEPVDDAPVVQAPSLEPAILAQVRDDTRAARLQLEPAALAHLLERALNTSAAAAQALGRPEQPVPLADLRAHAASWRGHWLHYRGRITELSGPKPGHPVQGHDIHEAVLRLDDGGEVLFAFTLPPDGLQVGAMARAEGFLLKLRDTAVPPEHTQAPLLVGRALQRDFADWPPVTTLDANKLRGIADTERRADGIAETKAAWRTLDEDQDEPLWHLAAYARDADAAAAIDWRTAPLLDQPHTWPQLVADTMPRGTALRVRGRVVDLRRIAAQPNPAHVQRWTEAWLEVDDLGGKAVPVWLPTAVRAELGAVVQARGLWYRRFAYESRSGQQLWAPLLVAATLDPVAVDSGAGMRTFGWLALVGLGALGGFAWASNRRLQRDSAQHEARLAERRRRRLARTGSGSDAP